VFQLRGGEYQPAESNRLVRVMTPLGYLSLTGEVPLERFELSCPKASGLEPDVSAVPPQRRSAFGGIRTLMP
jgi:hypothetical protein